MLHGEGVLPTAHFATEGKRWAVRVNGRTLLEQVEGDLGVVNDDDVLTEDGDGGDGAVEVFVLGPVNPFLLTRGRQVEKVADERTGFGTWRERASCSLRGCLGLGREEEVLDEEEPEATDENVSDEKKRGHREGREGRE